MTYIEILDEYWPSGVALIVLIAVLLSVRWGDPK
jgi:hypothetical protein